MTGKSDKQGSSNSRHRHHSQFPFEKTFAPCFYLFASNGISGMDRERRVMGADETNAIYNVYAREMIMNGKGVEV